MRVKLVFCLFFASLLFIGSITSSQMASAELSFSLEFGSFGTTEGKFKAPSGLAFDRGNDLLYVADTDNDRIQIFDVDGNCSGSDEVADDVCFVDEFGESGNGEGEFDLPSGLALDTSTNYLYVADTKNNRIQIFDVDGNCSGSDEVANDVCFIDEFGESGNGEGEFDLPSGLALHTDNDMLYVADTDNNQIQIIDVDGNCSGNIELADDICFVDEFGGSGDDDGEFNNPSGLTLDVSNDMLYVADTDNERIQIIDVDGNCSGSDELADDVCFEDEFGKNGDDDGEFVGLSALVFNSSDDLLYVADTGNNRIQIIDLSESSASSENAPSRPTNLEAYPISTTSIFLTWDVADPDEDVTGYKIESREGSENYSTLASNTGSNANSFVHGGLSDSNTYSYRIYAINDKGTSSASSTASEKPEDSLAPAALTATAISPTKIKLSWFPPTSTFGQSIGGYILEREIINDVYDEIETVGSGTTTYTISNLQTDKTYTYVVKAKFSSGGGSPRSNTASATPNEDSTEPTSSSISAPSSPNLTAQVISETQINLSWSKPSDGGAPITGYKIEVKENSGSFSILVENTKSTTRTYSHTNLTPNSNYTYKVSAINGLGPGSSSNESSGTPTEAPEELEIKPLGRLSIDEGNRLAFIVGITDTSLDNVRFSLASNAPSGASIDSSSGSFTWTPSQTQSGTYTFDVIAKTSSLEDRESITITVNDIPDIIAEPPKEEPKEEPKEPIEPKEFGIAPFVDQSKDPQSYVDRYNNEPSYQKWFDDNYSEYDSIYEAVGLKESKGIAPFVDPNQEPQYYVDRYNNEPSYKEWFDSNFPEYDSIYEAVGLDEPVVVPPKIGVCGEGTKLIDGICTVVDQPGGGCLIATAAYGSEMAPQVQFLREIRDNKVMSTQVGSSFMTGFNEFYYSFSPAIADYERENPLFKEAVKIGLTPMLFSLSLLSAADVDSEQGMLGYGIAIIMLNIGMYFMAPAMLLYSIKKAGLVKF